MKNKLILGLVALLVVAGGAGVIAQRNKGEKQSSSAKTSQATPAPNANQKSETEKNFESYVGEDYDRYFIANMIAHHQGAIDMAKLAQTNAKHDELKKMANDIITAQTSEISSMEGYQKAWGYPDSTGDDMQDMSSMGMSDNMAAMSQKLAGKTGDEFDKTFISLMIQHHTSAIDMSKPAAKNAAHQEVKTMAAGIIAAQTKEISQMKQWQKQWGYAS